MAYDRAPYFEAIKADLEQNIFFHSLALEACMGGIHDFLAGAGQLPSDEPPKDDWLLAGLVHDADFFGEFKAEHPKKTVEALAKHNLAVSDSVIAIIRAHGPSYTGVYPKSKAQWAIFCADSLTGLVMACALVLPSKKLADVKLSSVLKRFKDPKFAAGTRRDEVAMCANPEGLNIPLEKFVEICLISMVKVAPQIGL
jgi:predicted hydrolase (HD superfamily)